MESSLAIVVAVLFGVGFYQIMRRSLLKVILGLLLIGHAANLLVFTAAGLQRGPAPIIAREDMTPPVATSDPLPQALVLTAIVISFGLSAFILVLFRRVYDAIGTDDLDIMRTTERK